MADITIRCCLMASIVITISDEQQRLVCTFEKTRSNTSTHPLVRTVQAMTCWCNQVNIVLFGNSHNRSHNRATRHIRLGFDSFLLKRLLCIPQIKRHLLFSLFLCQLLPHLISLRFSYDPAISHGHNLFFKSPLHQQIFDVFLMKFGLCFDHT